MGQSHQRVFFLCLLLLVACGPKPPTEADLTARLRQLEKQMVELRPAESKQTELEKVRDGLKLLEAWHGDPGRPGEAASRVVQMLGKDLVVLQADRPGGEISFSVPPARRKPLGDRLSGQGWEVKGPIFRRRLSNPEKLPGPRTVKTPPASTRESLEQRIEQIGGRIARARQAEQNMQAITAELATLTRKRGAYLREIYGKDHEPEDPLLFSKHISAELPALLAGRGQITRIQVGRLQIVGLCPTPLEERTLPAGEFDFSGFPAREVLLNLRGRPEIVCKFLVELEKCRAKRLYIVRSIRLDGPKAEAEVRLWAYLRE